MIEEKREMIIREINDIPENVLDNILALIEESKKPEKKDGESALEALVKSGILIPPIGPPKAEAKRIAIKGKGKPLSEMIIEDRR